MRVKTYFSRLIGLWGWLRRQLSGCKARYSANAKYEKLKKSDSETYKHGTEDGSRVSYLHLVSIYRTLHKYSKNLNHRCPFYGMLLVSLCHFVWSLLNIVRDHLYICESNYYARIHCVVCRIDLCVDWPNIRTGYYFENHSIAHIWRWKNFVSWSCRCTLIL